MKKAVPFIALIVAMFFAAGPVAAQTDYSTNPTAEVSTTNYTPGTQISVSGVGAPNAPASATLYGQAASLGFAGAPLQSGTYTLASTTTDGSGNYTLSFSMPTGIACGSYSLEVAVNGIAAVTDAVTYSSNCVAQTTGGTTGGGTNAAPSPQLALTGVETAGLAVLGGSLLAGGAMLVIGTRRRNQG